MAFSLRDFRLDRLARRARSGDRAAFLALYRALHPAVSRYLARRVRRREDAEDLTARTFHRLLERLGDLDPEKGPVAAFALAIARNALSDQRRSERPTLPLEAAEEVAGGLDPHLQAERAEGLLWLRRRLDALPSAVREILELRFGDGLRHAEIAALTGSTEAAVRQRLSRALRELRRGTDALPEGALAHDP